MGILEIIKLKKQLNKQLTPLFAHKLLSEMPVNCHSVFYDAECKKFFKHGEFGELLAWSATMQKWILWLHKPSEKTVFWTFIQIRNMACKYQYKIGDQVLYCGIDNRYESSVYTVVGFDSQGKVIVNDGQEQFGGYFMNCWRLATTEEQEVGERQFVG